MRIFKYLLSIEDMQGITMPAGAEILTVQMQDGVPTIWAMVREGVPSEVRHFATYGTGHPMGSGFMRKYIGTYQTHHGLVFHVFEEKP